MSERQRSGRVGARAHTQIEPLGRHAAADVFSRDAFARAVFTRYVADTRDDGQRAANATRHWRAPTAGRFSSEPQQHAALVGAQQFDANAPGALSLFVLAAQLTVGA